MQDLFTNTFPLDGKIKLSVVGVCENGREKKWFGLAKISVSTNGNRLFFKTWISPMVSTRRKKSSNKRMLIQVDTKSVSWNGEFI